VRWSAPTELQETISNAAAHISEEVLATTFSMDEKIAAADNELGVGLYLEKITKG
jgi:hypothetical protein